MNPAAPDYLALFWDTDPGQLDVDRHAAYILTRILERGSWKQWTGARKYYGRQRLTEVLTRVRALDPKAVAFCSVVLGVPQAAFAAHRQSAARRSACAAHAEL